MTADSAPTRLTPGQPDESLRRNGEQDPVNGDKDNLRAQLRELRRNRPEADRDAARSANTTHLLDRLAGIGQVCAFLPLASEPVGRPLLDALVARGTSVLVPVVTGAQPLDWCRYPVRTVPGAFGIAQPTGRRLGPAAVAGVDAVLVPALAIDFRGHRLGRGGGHYDRSLALLGTPAPVLIGVLFDGEWLATLPAEPHDRPVDAVVSPAAGFALIDRR